MREYKFRAWDNVREKMVSVIGIIQWGSMEIEVENESRDTYEIDDEEDFVLMQYTGLKDKNGKEIYDGDIVNVDSYELCNPFVIVFEDGCFWFGAKLIKGYDREDPVGLYSQGEIEVIGNIYENSDLIK